MNNIAFKKLTTLVFCFLSVGSFSQNYDKSLLEQITPTDPTSASLGKYGVYPVNYSTGLVPITIPLYTIKSGDLTQTIELSYHGGGLRVSEESTWVGLGWDLNFGGVITRTMNGFPDEYEIYPVPNADSLHQIINNSTNFSNELEYKNLADAATITKSFKPDLYQYNFGNYSGTFISVNNKPVSISHAAITGNVASGSINLIDPSGNFFDFTGNETTTLTGALVKNEPYISGYSIKSIISANNTDSIRYTYQQDGRYSNLLESYSQGYKKTITTCIVMGVGSGQNNPCLGSTKIVESPEKSNAMFIQSVDSYKPEYIYFHNGRITFNLGDRLDVNPNSNKIHKLENIVVESYDAGRYETVKVIQFYYTYFNQGGNYNELRLRLDSVAELASFQSTERKCLGRFVYNADVPLPNKKSLDFDYWGYYNGKNNSSAIPLTFTQEYTFGAADKTPDSYFAKQGIIKSISYPTKGKTEFIWESNRVNSETPIYFKSQITSGSISSDTSSPFIHLIPGIDDYGYKSITIHPYFDQYVSLDYYLYRLNTTDEEHQKHDTGIILINGTTILDNLNTGSSTKHQNYYLQGNQDYVIELITNCNNVKGEIAFSYNSYNPYVDKNNYPFAGLRIQKINDYDSKGNLLTEKSYTYLDSLGHSSGYITNDKRLSYNQNTYYKGIEVSLPAIVETTNYMWYSTAKTGLEASNFGYEQVQEYNMSNGQNSGYSNYKFSKGESDVLLNDDTPLISKNHTRGQLLQQVDYIRNSDNSYKRIKETNKYYSKDSRVVAKKRGFLMRNLMSYSNADLYNYISTEKMYLSDVFNPINYDYTSDWIKLDSTVTKEYFQLASPVTTKTSYVYGNEKHLQPTEIKTYLNNGDIKKSNTIYPNDDNSTIAGDMVARNMLVLPLDIKEYVMKNGSTQKLVDGNKLTYEKINNNILLTKVADYLPDGTTDDSFWYSYNDHCRMIEATGKDGVKTSVIWDAKNYNPIVEAVNMSYSNLAAAMQSVNNVPGALYSLDATKQAKISTYSYIPLIGLKSETDERGLATYYNYDGLGRLSEVYRMVNGVKQVLKTYTYHFK